MELQIETKLSELENQFRELKSKSYFDLGANEVLSEYLELTSDLCEYERGANFISELFDFTMEVNFYKYGTHFNNDTENRCIFNITLKKGGSQYSFKFGQSIAEGSNEPTLYDVLTCLTKYEPGTFVEFCGDFGYELDSPQSKKVYNSVLKEWAGMNRIFSSEELDILSGIN
jgi:hypothetical protein